MRASVNKTSEPGLCQAVVWFLTGNHKFLLDQVLRAAASPRADYDLVIASQPYRARVPAEFKGPGLAPLGWSPLAPGAA